MTRNAVYRDITPEYRKFKRPFPLPLPLRSPQCCRGAPRHRERPPRARVPARQPGRLPAARRPRYEPLRAGQGELLHTSGTVARGLLHPSGTRGDAAEGLLLGEKRGHRRGPRARSCSARRRLAVPHADAARPCLPTHWPGEGAPPAQDQTRAVWPPRASDPGWGHSTPDEIRRRTRRRLLGGHAPGQAGAGPPRASDAGGCSGPPRRAGWPR
jgi:hypothetical protein